MPSEIQVHRQVQLNDANISETTKLALNDLLKNIYPIILKRDNDIGQMDLIEMHIATRPDTTPVATCPYHLVLKHHDFLKQKIRNLLDAGIIHKSMSPWASSILAKKHISKGSPQQLQLCINYRKLNSLLLTITPATGTMKCVLALMSLPKIDELFVLLKGAKYFTTLDM